MFLDIVPCRALAKENPCPESCMWCKVFCFIIRCVLVIRFTVSLHVFPLYGLVWSPRRKRRHYHLIYCWQYWDEVNTLGINGILLAWHYSERHQTVYWYFLLLANWNWYIAHMVNKYSKFAILLESAYTIYIINIGVYASHIQQIHCPVHCNLCRYSTIKVYTNPITVLQILHIYIKHWILDIPLSGYTSICSIHKVMDWWQSL